MAESMASLGVDLAEVRRDLAKLPNMTADAAQGMLIQLERTVARAEAAAKAATRNVSKSAQDSAKAAEAAFSSVGSGVMKVAGALDLVDERLGSAARVLGDLADSGEVAGAAAGGLGISMGTLGAAAGALLLVIGPMVPLYLDYTEAAENAAAAEAAWAGASDRHITLAQQVTAAQRAALVATGAWTEEQREALDIGDQWVSALAEANGPLEERLAVVQEQLATNRVTSASYADLMEEEKKLSAEIATNTANAAAGETADRKAARAKRDSAAAAELEKQAEREAAEAKAQAAAAATRAAEREREYAAAMAAAQAQARTYRDAVAGIHQVGQEATDGELEGVAKLVDAREASLLRLAELEQTAIESSLGNIEALADIDAETAAAREAVWERYYADLATLQAEQADKEAEDAAKAAADRAEELAQLRDTAVGTMSTVFESLNTIFETGAEQLAGANEKASLRLFRLSQVAAVAQGTLAAWKAATEAASAAAAGGPVAAAAAGFATFALMEGAFVAQIAAQKPPSFAFGGVTRAQTEPDHIAVTRTEAMIGILGPRGVETAGGLEGVRALNQGIRLPPVVVTQERGTVVDERVTRFRLRGPGALSRRLDESGSTGKKRR